MVVTRRFYHGSVIEFNPILEVVFLESLSLQFMNSEWSDWRGSGRKEDRLDRPGWLEAFLAEWKLEAPIPPEPEHRMALGEMRSRLRSMTEMLREGCLPEKADIDYLNKAMEQIPAYPQLSEGVDGYRLDSKVSAVGWPSILGLIALSFAELLVHEDYRRIKICENTDCRWVFFDGSRSRTARWCSDTECGNLMKVRNFRKRKKDLGLN
jgi:predicted RNA-binding Zn ribbon-like protein